MSRYRRIETGTRLDKRFRKLSRPAPNAQDLFIYLLTGERTTIFPGLIVATEQTIADDFKWPLAPVAGARSPSCLRDCWAELVAQGMAEAEWEAGVIVLTKALRLGTGATRESARPSSPNVFRGWATSWPEVPDCDLKDRYLIELGAFAQALDLERQRLARESASRTGRRALSKRSASARLVLEDSKNAYHEAYLDVYSSALRALGEHSASTQRPARVPDPVSVPEIYPEQEVVSPPSSGASGPSSDRLLERDPESGPAPAVPTTTLPTPVRAREAPAGAESRDELRKRLTRELVELHAERFNATREAIGSQVPAMRGAGWGTDSERQLRELLVALPSLEGFEARARHVIAVREAEARTVDPRRGLPSLKFFGPNLWRADNFDRACTMEIGEQLGGPPAAPRDPRFGRATASSREEHERDAASGEDF